MLLQCKDFFYTLSQSQPLIVTKKFGFRHTNSGLLLVDSVKSFTQRMHSHR